jgi:phosphopantothenoylcysteine decarboxylase/phosphopantothenate--cysteine ligase
MTSPRRRPLAFLITAGPTIEDLDPVRFISNRATGRLGVELGRAALRAGHRVLLIHGPLQSDVWEDFPRSRRFTALAVRSAEQMHRTVMRHLSRADVVVMNAAVADYTPVATARDKIKKSRFGLTLRLKPTVDILRELGRLKARGRDFVLIGFALETGAGRTEAERRRARLAEAQRKLREKRLDAIILDTPSEMGATSGAFTLLDHSGKCRKFAGFSKARLARVVVELSESCAACRLPRRSRPVRQPVFEHAAAQSANRSILG